MVFFYVEVILEYTTVCILTPSLLLRDLEN